MAQRFDDLRRGGNAATLLSTPYDLLAQQAGLRLLARLESPYQGNVGAARRGWAGDNPGFVGAYIQAYIEARGWVYNPANQRKACDILQRHVPPMTREL